MMKSMKTLAALAALLLAVLVSCGKEGDNPGAGEGITRLPDPAFKKTAMKLSVIETSCPVKTIELTEGGRFLVEKQDGPTFNKEYDFGGYKITGEGKYSFDNGSSLEVTPVRAAVSFTLKLRSGEEYSGTASVQPASSSSSDIASNLFRTWSVTKTRVSVTDGVKANADFTGCNLGEIADFLRAQSLDIQDDLKGLSVSEITVTASGSFVIKYSDGTVDVAHCQLSSIASGAFSYSWESQDMGFSFENGNGSVAFEKSYCILSLGATVKSGSRDCVVSLQLVMAEKK